MNVRGNNWDEVAPLRYGLGEAVEWKSSDSGLIVSGVVTRHWIFSGPAKDRASDGGEYEVMLLDSPDARDRRGRKAIRSENDLAPAGAHGAVDFLHGAMPTLIDVVSEDEGLHSRLVGLACEVERMADDPARRPALAALALALFGGH